MLSLDTCSGDGQLKIDSSFWRTFYTVCGPHSRDVNALITDTPIMATLLGMATGVYIVRSKTSRPKQSKVGVAGK